MVGGRFSIWRLQLTLAARRLGLLANDDAAAQQMTCVKDQLKWLNDLMVSNKYICGDNFTICDAILFGQIWFFCINPAFGAPAAPLCWAAEDMDIPWLKVGNRCALHVLLGRRIDAVLPLYRNGTTRWLHALL